MTTETEKAIEQAGRDHGLSAASFDETPAVSRSETQQDETGAYVQAWVWVERESIA